MKTIQFQNLNGINFDIHKIIIIDHVWQQDDSFDMPEEGRPDNGIMFLSDCEFEYIDSDGVVYDRAVRNNIVYSPIGSKYSCRFKVPEHVGRLITDYLINFRLFDESGEELRLADDRMIILPENPRYYADSFSRISSMGRRGLLSQPRIKGLLYNLLSDLALELQKNEIMTRRYASIYPAIKYIRTTSLAELNAADLADQCHLSQSCFRRLFREYTGMPPLEYINHMKISQAKIRLQSGLLSVSEVAESLGFSDVSYFSRFYKKATGHSPSEDMN